VKRLKVGVDRDEMNENRLTAVVLLVVLCVGCSATLPYALERSPHVPLLDYDPDVYVAPGIPQGLCNLDLDLMGGEFIGDDTKIGNSLNNRLGWGIGAGTLNLRNGGCGGSASGGPGHGPNSFQGPYSASAEHLIAITPKGFVVLFLRESGSLDAKGQFRASNTTSATVLFPFNAVTKVTIFGDTKVVGVFTNRIDATGQPEAGGYRR
jgi:hypothetical protein